MSLLSDNLRSFMDARGIKARGLSSASGVSKTQIYTYLKGEESPSLENLERMAKGLRVPVWCLLCPPDLVRLLRSKEVVDLLQTYNDAPEPQKELLRRLAELQVPQATGGEAA